MFFFMLEVHPNRCILNIQLDVTDEISPTFRTGHYLQDKLLLGGEVNEIIMYWFPSVCIMLSPSGMLLTKTCLIASTGVYGKSALPFRRGVR